MTWSLPPLSRREFLARTGTGLPMLGLASVLADDAAAATRQTIGPHFAPKAKRVIHVFCNGGPSHVDTFDPKPELSRYHGKPLPVDLKTERKTGNAFGSPFPFARYGESGLEVSDLFAKTAAAAADELCVIRSMHANQPNHEPSFLLMNTGESRLPRPAVGSWVTYGLGSENRNLPGFLVLCPNGYPTTGPANWRSAFLPGSLQGSYVDTRHREVEKLIANSKSRLAPEAQRRQLDLLQAMNREHAAARPEEAALESRIESFELAFRMQSDAAEAFDITREPQHIQEAYGCDRKQGAIQARQLLIARRLVERGVRYVQVYQDQSQPWDHHDKLEQGHRRLADQLDQPLAALLTDLRERGLLGETLVLWGGEFGRTPVVEMPVAGVNQGSQTGRDHNHYGFSVFLAGGGVRGGHVHGATDEFGFKAIEDRVHVHDLHATMLHLLGFDHKRLTYRYAGRDFRLTDVHGRVVEGLLA